MIKILTYWFWTSYFLSIHFKKYIFLCKQSFNTIYECYGIYECYVSYFIWI